MTLKIIHFYGSTLLGIDQWSGEHHECHCDWSVCGACCSPSSAHPTITASPLWEHHYWGPRHHNYWNSSGSATSSPASGTKWPRWWWWNIHRLYHSNWNAGDKGTISTGKYYIVLSIVLSELCLIGLSIVISIIRLQEWREGMVVHDITLVPLDYPPISPRSPKKNLIWCAWTVNCNHEITYCSRSWHHSQTGHLVHVAVTIFDSNGHPVINLGLVNPWMCEASLVLSKGQAQTYNNYYYACIHTVYIREQKKLMVYLNITAPSLVE